MNRCLTCEHKKQEGHLEPCIRCIECGVPYAENLDILLSDQWRLNHDLPEELEVVLRCMDYAYIGKGRNPIPSVDSEIFSKIYDDLKNLAWDMMRKAGCEEIG